MHIDLGEPDVAREERDLILTRTGEGRARARGVKMGRPSKLTSHQVQEALSRRNTGEPMRELRNHIMSVTEQFQGWRNE